MHNQHHYTTRLVWTGNQGTGTKNYRVYSRDHEISVHGGLHNILGSSDPSFRGDPARYNPEELLLASLSACHMLWYLHLCAVNNVVVTSYTDAAKAVMEETEKGSGRFVSATLYPQVTVSEAGMIETAVSLHNTANEKCFIANSVNFPIHHEVTINAVK